MPAGNVRAGKAQQRLSFARAFLLRPDWLFLDEATASLDPEAEEDEGVVLGRAAGDEDVNPAMRG